MKYDLQILYSYDAKRIGKDVRECEFRHGNILKRDPSFKFFNGSKYFDFINVFRVFRLAHVQIFKTDVSLYADALNILETTLFRIHMYIENCNIKYEYDKLHK